MKEFQYVVRDEIGIHARPAGLLAKEAKAFESRIVIRKGERSAEAKKLMMVMSLGIACGDEVTVTVEGADEEAAYAAVKAFFEKNL